MITLSYLGREFKFKESKRGETNKANKIRTFL